MFKPLDSTYPLCYCSSVGIAMKLNILEIMILFSMLIHSLDHIKQRGGKQKTTHAEHKTTPKRATHSSPRQEIGYLLKQRNGGKTEELQEGSLFRVYISVGVRHSSVLQQAVRRIASIGLIIRFRSAHRAVIPPLAFRFFSKRAFFCQHATDHIPVWMVLISSWKLELEIHSQARFPFYCIGVVENGIRDQSWMKPFAKKLTTSSFVQIPWSVFFL